MGQNIFLGAFLVEKTFKMARNNGRAGAGGPVSGYSNEDISAK
jgi:hypothetical protein